MSLSKHFNTIKKEEGVLKELDKYLLTAEESNDRAINVNSPSQIGKCLRARVYSRIHPLQRGKVEPRTQRIFDNGTHVHLRLQEYLLKAGILLMDEVPVINEEYNIQGHTDGLVKVRGKVAVLEIKSMNSFQFNKLMEAKPEHLLQALTYLFCLEERRKLIKEAYSSVEELEEDKEELYKEYAELYQHIKGGKKHTREEKIKFQCDICFQRDIILFNLEHPLEEVVFFYECKDNQEIKEFTVSIKGNEDLLDTILDDCDYVEECCYHKELPCRECTGKSDSNAKYCDYKSICFI